jgi:hypothetical protein
VPSAAAHLTVVYPPVFLSAVQSNCTLTLSWSASVGQRYRLEYKPTLSGTNWSFLTKSIYATGSVVTTNDTVCTNTQRFYRVELYPVVQ